MTTTNDKHLTQSMKMSAYFQNRMENDNYDPLVYENTCGNWFKMVSMLILFYCLQALFWWGNFEFGIADAVNMTYFNIAIFIWMLLVIASLLVVGHFVNQKKMTHDYYTEKISEEK